MSPYCKISHARLALSSPPEALLLGRQKVDSIGKEGIFPGSGMPAFTTGRRPGLLHPQPRRSHAAIAPQKLDQDPSPAECSDLAAVTRRQPSLSKYESVLAKQRNCSRRGEEAVSRASSEGWEKGDWALPTHLQVFCLLEQCPSHPDLFRKMVPSLLTPTPRSKTRGRPTCSLKAAERISLHVGVWMETLEQRLSLGPLHRGSWATQGWASPSGTLGSRIPHSPAERSLLRNHRVPPVSGFYSRREAESFSPRVTL